MSETTSGVRAVLSLPAVYELAQRTIGSVAFRQEVANTMVRAQAGDRVLDIGCGPGDLLPHLPETTYTGFDPSSSYIASAREQFGDRGQFFVADVESARSHAHGPFDRVIATGVLHHLDDATARSLWRLARDVVAPGGRVVTVDPCFHDEQHPMARWLASRDRGQAVRRPEEYAAFAREVFDDVTVSLRTDMLRVPYSHAVIVAHADER